MDKFENISVRGFRRLQQVDLEMRDLIVMIGANGAGKTSFQACPELKAFVNQIISLCDESKVIT